jgi:hypothetical protein
MWNTVGLSYLSFKFNREATTSSPASSYYAPLLFSSLLSVPSFFSFCFSDNNGVASTGYGGEADACRSV